MWWELEELLQKYPPESQLIDSIIFPVKKDCLTESFLREKYLDEGLSSSEIAALAFSSRSTVTKRLKQYGIPLKMVTRRETGSQVFGYRKFGGRAVEVKTEQAIIGMIQTYRQQGYSYQKIADLLNEQKVKTKLRQGFWYSKVVRAIYLRQYKNSV